MKVCPNWCITVTVPATTYLLPFSVSGPDLVNYPPLLNFYEKKKDAPAKCEESKPRFQIAQSEPECHHQQLSELLIRPVKRLSGILLLLDDIVK